MRRSLFKWLNFKIILGGVLFAICTFAALLAILWSSRQDGLPSVPSTALFNIIEAPTQTLPALVVTPIQTPTPTVAPGEPQPNKDIALGDYVQVTGTGGDGLRLHASAGVSGKVNYIAIDSEVMLVKDGPIDADGYTWWLLQDPYTQDANGWGAGNYLVVVQNPN